MSITLSVNFPGLDAKGQKLKAGHASGIQTLCNKTDAGRLQMLDPETLEPVGLAAQSVLHPELKGPLSAAHARSDPKTGDMYNYNLDLGRKGLYRVFHVSAATGETSILATFPADAAYIHSFFITENYIVLCVWNSFFAAGGIKILWNRNLVDAMSDYDGSRPARWYVIDRRTPANGGKGVVATYESDDFFCFHTVNAHEVPSESGTGKDIVADLIAYDNLDCIKRFYISNLISTSESAAKYAEKPNYCTVYKRFRLPGIPDADSTKTAPTLKAKLDFQAEAAQTPELPTLNPHYLTRPHRYVYGANFTGKSTFMDTLIKYDVEAREAKQWYSHGQNPGEPIFVPRPGGSDEDDGVLLSVVLDGLAGKSYLLVLDAKSLQEVARAHVNGAIGFGFHGTHVSAAKDAVPLSL
jgi:torulene dioxygenase